MGNRTWKSYKKTKPSDVRIQKFLRFICNK